MEFVTDGLAPIAGFTRGNVVSKEGQNYYFFFRKQLSPFHK